MRAIVLVAHASVPMLSATILGLALMTAPALAQTFKAWKCTGDSDIAWDEQIVGCSNAITKFAGRDLAAAFNNRGNAYHAKGNPDRAMGDYNEAIRHDPKSAAAFNNRGNVYRDQGDLDRAMGDYNEAIRLEPKYAIAFNNRGNAHRDQGDPDRAIGDYTQAIRLDPKYAFAFNNRGNAYQAKGDLDRAIGDYTEAIRLDPKESGTYLNRGLANLYSGSLPKALADLNQSSELNPKSAHAALWRDIVDRRSNLPSRLAQAMTQIDMTKWPAPIIRLYLGQMAPEAVLDAADDPNVDTKKNQLCEANFYIGQLALLRGTKDEAMRQFQLAATACRKNTNLWAGANAELKALGAQP